MWNKKEMSHLDATLTRVPVTVTFDLDFWPWNLRSNCISGMGGSIVMEQKRQESLGCPDVKPNHYVTLRQRILLPTGWLKMSAFPLTSLVSLMLCLDGHEGLSNYQPHDCLLNRLLRHSQRKHQSSVSLAFVCGDSPVTGEFPTQRASNVENFSIWWCHHVLVVRRAGLLWSQQDFEWLWSVPLSSASLY